MERLYKSYKFGKLYNTISNYDESEVNSRTPYNRYHNKTILINDYNRENQNDNLSEVSNSVHTSYKYRKRKKGNITMASKDFYFIHNHNYQEQDNDSSVSISTNENLICPDCINDALTEEKNLGDNLYKKNNRIDLYQDNNNNYSNNLIEKKRQQREKYTNYAMQTLSKLNSSISSKERLIEINENSSNPFQGNHRDYQYEKFKQEYDKRQKIINNNIDKYFPEQNKKSISETPLFFDKSEEKSKTNQKNKFNKKEYIQALEEQIKYKNDKKRKEREEDKKMEKKCFEDIEEKMKKEEEDKLIKEKNLKDNFIKSNMDIIDQKNRDKMKELREKLKYKESLDKQNDLYKKELLEKQKENERLLNEIYNSNKKESEEHKKIKEKQRYNNNENYYENNKYYENDNINNNISNDINNKIEMNNHKYNLDDQKGECCRCHRILPRRMLTINRYFYKEKRNKNIY